MLFRSKAFCRIIDGMLLKEPSDRYQSMAEIIDELASWKPAGLVPMPRGEAIKGNAVESIAELELEGGASDETTSPRSDGTWPLGEADSVSPASGRMVVDPLGRDEPPVGPSNWPTTVARIGGWAFGCGLGGGVVAAAVATAAGSQNYGGAVPLVIGLLVAVVTAAVLSVATVLRQGDH